MAAAGPKAATNTSVKQSYPVVTVLAVELVFEVRGYDDPDVALAIDELQQEYVRRYGQSDAAAVDPLEFAAPDGLFLVCLLDGEIGAMGGWRRHDDESVEVKRMYVPERLRRRGLGDSGQVRPRME